MKHLIIAGTAAAVLLAAVSCGGSGRSRRSDGSDGPASYLTVGNSKIAFIQWRATPNGQRDRMVTGGNGGRGEPGPQLLVPPPPPVPDNGPPLRPLPPSRPSFSPHPPPPPPH